MDKACPTQPGGGCILIATSNATYYNNSTKTRRYKSKFFVGFLDNSMSVSASLKFISFILTRRSGPNGVHASSWWSHANRMLMNSMNPHDHVCLLIQHHPRNPTMFKYTTKTTTASKPDMFRHGSRHPDMSRGRLDLCGIQ